MELRLSNRVDSVFYYIKWPVAVIALITLIPSGWASLTSIFHLIKKPWVSIPFFAGFSGYYALWRMFFRKQSFGSIISTTEHEFTHAIFAWLTLHRVSNFNVTWSQGGSVAFTPPGNWLIFLGPYFFPTITFILLPFTFTGASWIFITILGISVSYHMTSTWLETHSGQSDLQKTGILFSFAFLPTANFICYGLIASVLINGISGFSKYFLLLGENTGKLMSFIS